MDPANKQGFEDFTRVNHLQISKKNMEIIDICTIYLIQTPSDTSYVSSGTQT